MGQMQNPVEVLRTDLYIKNFVGTSLCDVLLGISCLLQHAKGMSLQNRAFNNRIFTMTLKKAVEMLI